MRESLQRAQPAGQERHAGREAGVGVRHKEGRLGNNVDSGDIQRRLGSWPPCGWGAPHMLAHTPTPLYVRGGCCARLCLK